MRYRLKLKKQAQVAPVQPTTLDKLKSVLTSDLAKRTLGMGLGGMRLNSIIQNLT